MLQAEAYAHPVSHCQLIQTHISWVILTGEFVYKIKKPVNLGFLDFSTLEKRCFFCKEELRLNSRLAPDLYLDVMDIRGNPEHPALNGDGELIECAVKMKQFAQEDQLDSVLERGELKLTDIDSIALMIANFHQHIDSAGSKTHFGNPESVCSPIADNFSHSRQHINDNAQLKMLAKIETWSANACTTLRETLTARKNGGFIRECHGDLHLRNLAWINNAPLAFDCLEFNPDLRWIDIISEIAFLAMDLEDHHQTQMAHRFVNAYLEHSGDYAGIRVLRFYKVYRAMVRAKVDAISAGQADINSQEQHAALESVGTYLRLAQSYIHMGMPKLIITRGLSASGKSTISQHLLEHLGAIRIRSDIERKRLFNLQATQSGGNDIEKGIYSNDATQATYTKLATLAKLIVDAGYTVIVDAANLEFEKREAFQQLATQLQVPYLILNFTATPDTLRQRIVDRKNDASDANLKVLEHQLRHYQDLLGHEYPSTIIIDTEKNEPLASILNQIEQIAIKQVK